MIGFFGEKYNNVYEMGDHSHTVASYRLFKHFIFSISYNGNNVGALLICINASTLSYLDVFIGDCMQFDSGS